MEDFYRGFAQRARDLAENADPFTRRRLLDLAQRGEAVRFDLERLEDPAFAEAIQAVYPEAKPIGAGRTIYDEAA